MTQTQDEPLKLTRPIATEKVFGTHAEAIDYHLSELIMDIHLAGDSAGDDAIYHAQSLIGTCYTLMGYLMTYQDELISIERYRNHAEK